jgi:hypothetical protein
MLPPIKDDIWKAFLILRDFEALNGKAISNAVRAAAYQVPTHSCHTIV